MIIKDMFQKGKRVLILTEKVPDFASILCCNVLINLLNREGLKANWFIDETKLPTSQRKILPKDKTSLITSFSSKDFFVDVVDSELEAVKVEKGEEKIRLVFNTKQGNMTNKVLTLESLKLEYDLILVFTNKEVGKIIRNTEIKERVGESANVYYLQESMTDSIGLKVCEMIFESQLDFDSQEATVLLSAVLWEVLEKNNLKFYETVNQLITKHKANFEKAVSVSNFSLTEVSQVWRADVARNVKFEDNIKYSIVKVSDLKISNLTNLSNEQKFPFNNGGGLDNQLIISKLKSSTLVFVKGKLVEKLVNIEARYMNLNSGVLTIVTDLVEEEILKTLGIAVSKTNQTVEKTENIVEEILNEKPLEVKPVELTAVENSDKQVPKETLEKDKKTVTKEVVGADTEKRSTSVLSKQEPKKITVVNSSIPQKKKSFDPLPAANW